MESQFVSALEKAKVAGFKSLAKKAGDLWHVISIKELLVLGAWPAPPERGGVGGELCGKLVKSLPPKSIKSGDLVMRFYPAH